MVRPILVAHSALAALAPFAVECRFVLRIIEASMTNPYAELGVDESADQDAIKKAFKKLARKYHPDRNSNPGAAERFKEINAAHDILSDPEKRQLYDEFGDVSLRPGFNAEQARAWHGASPRAPFGQGAPFGDFPGGFRFHGAGGMEDILSSMFGSGAQRRATRGANRQVEVTIDFMKSVLGSEDTIRLSQPDGRVETIKFRIPAGVKNGGLLTLKGHGLPPVGGGPCGDLKIRLNIDEHPHLRRIENNDLEMDVPITILEAMKGAAITIPTPTGLVKVNIPAGVSSHVRLRIKGRGIQTPVPGDLFVDCRPVLPRSNDPGVLQAAQRLEEAYVGDLRGKIRI